MVNTAVTLDDMGFFEFLEIEANNIKAAALGPVVQDWADWIRRIFGNEEREITFNLRPLDDYIKLILPDY